VNINNFFVIDVGNTDIVVAIIKNFKIFKIKRFKTIVIKKKIFLLFKKFKEIKKIVICDLQNEIYPKIEKIFLNLLNVSGFPGIKIEKKPKEVKIWFRIPKKLTKYVVKKGSIALDGISLTLVDVKKDIASVCLIPHTINVTNFKSKEIGDKLNIETDVLGKYILK